MKLILSEKQILTTIRLSSVQKEVLTKIIAAPSEELAYEQISDGRNLVAARDILAKLKLIEFTEGSATVTDSGKKVMKDENLIDDSDQLTPDGEQFVQAQNASDTQKPQAGAEPTEPAAGAAGSGGGDDLDLSLESQKFTLLKDIQQALNEKK